jgi:hypothetical protein
MTEIYIQGIGSCKKKVRKALSKSSLIEGDHYIEGVNSLHEHNQTLLYWKSSRVSIKDFKKAIGADIIWEHRLRFYESVDDLPKVKSESFDRMLQDEIALMDKYRPWDSSTWREFKDHGSLDEEW